MKITKEIMTTMRHLRGKKYSFQKIADRVGISKTYCVYLLNPMVKKKELDRKKVLNKTKKKLKLGEEIHNQVKQSYSELGSLKLVSLKFGISGTTVKRIVNPEYAKKDNERRTYAHKLERQAVIAKKYNEGKRMCLCCSMFFEKTHKFNFVCPRCINKL